MKSQAQLINSIRVENLSFAYDGSAPVFENLSMTIPSHPVIWLRSPGGKGKSTFLRILAGLLVPSSGRYLINERAVNEMSFQDFLPYRLAIGYGFDMGGLLNNRTLVENLILPLLFHKLLLPEEAQKRVQEVTDAFAMASVRDQRPYSVSGSHRKLTCVLRSFIHWPQLVLLDDPETGLKEDNLKDLNRFMESGFEKRGLKQVILCGESRNMAKYFDAKELTFAQENLNLKAAA